MGNRGKGRRPRQARPVNPGQQELAIMNRMMENAIIARDRAEMQLQFVQAESRQAQLIVAILVQQLGGTVSITDDLIDSLNIEGLDVQRDDETGVVTITVVEGPALDDEEE